MPRRSGVALLCFLLGGCVSADGSDPTSAWQAMRVDTDPGPDRVLLDVALVQSPREDPFLDRHVWASADEMVLSPEQRELLELNGFRVGVLVGSPPEQLLDLLRSPRTCVERRGRSAPSGMTLHQVLRDAEGSAACRLYHGRSRETLNWERPRFGVDLTPQTLSGNKVRLRMAPRVEAAEKALNFKPLPEQSKWALEVKRPSRLLEGVAWQVDLLPNQVLIVGARLGREDTAGYHSFVRPEGDEPMQRLLVLRHLRSAATAEREVAGSPVDASLSSGQRLGTPGE